MKDGGTVETSRGLVDRKRLNRQARWLFWLAAVALVAAVVPIMLYVILWRAGETSPLNEIAASQLDDHGLYGTAIHDDTAYYKLALYEAIRPDVIAIGSSRVMQFRGEAFSASFVNLGGTVKGLSHAGELLPRLFSTHRPKLILFGLDFWWFNDVRKPRSSWLNRRSARAVSASTLRLPLEWYVKGKISPGEIIRVLKREDQSQFGIQAVLHRDGFDRFGSYHYTSTITGAKPHFDTRFKNILERVGKGNQRFEWGDTVSSDRWQEFLKILEVADSAGVPVILLLPPVAPTIVDAMKELGNYGLLDDLRTRLVDLGRPFYDFHDTRSFDAGDCAFIDGDHGGDILYAVMAARMEEAFPQLDFDWVDDRLVGEIVRTNTGAATARQWRFSSKPEVDFLKLGCR